MTWPQIIIGAVALQRIGELIYSAHNAKALKGRGAIEVGAGHYPVLIAVHVAWFGTMAAGVDASTLVNWGWLAIFAMLQVARVWVLVSLRGYWTTRLFHLPQAPLVSSGPYRFIRHPNYAVVAGEIAVLPLVFGLWWTAALFTLLNGAVLLWRMRIEDRYLDRRSRA